MANQPLSPQFPESSALSSLISTTTEPSSATTLTVLHNLQHQHLWSCLQVHDFSAHTTVSLISGIPPHRVYTHPDEQLYMLERGLREDDVELERMFVLPTVQGQPWSLEKMAAVFDALPEPSEGLESHPSGTGAEDAGETASTDKTAKLAEYYEYRAKACLTKEWGGKRLLLAMIDKGMGGDGTVVYYVVQEGTVKPRQN